MMIERSFDATNINFVLNHPSVRPDVAGDEEGDLDISAAVENEKNVLLMGEHGGVFFFNLLPGVFECHTQCLPAGRGKWIYRFVRECGVWMFTRTDAFEIATRIPEKHHAARHLAIHAGMQHEFTRPLETTWRGERQDCHIYSYRVQRWSAGAKELDERGSDFHSFLHDEATRLGVTARPHEDDAQHNRVVGVCLAMLEGGQVGKAVRLYNRWALLSRHAFIQLLSEDPIRIRFDIGDLVFVNGEYRVEQFKDAA
jgi:hypothetical protein